jgi:hypothetical protein
MKTREAISIVVAAAKRHADSCEAEETTQICDACAIVAALSNEPVNKPELMAQLFASMSVSDRVAILARLSALMHPGPTS